MGFSKRKKVHMIKLLLKKSYNFLLHNICCVTDNQVRIWTTITVYSTYNVNFNFLSQSRLSCNCLNKWHSFGHVWHYRSIKLASMASITFHVMHVNVLAFHPVTYFFILPRTVQLSSSVSFRRGCTDFRSLCSPFQPNKYHPSMASGRMMMGLQGCINLTGQSLLSSLFSIASPTHHFLPYVRATWLYASRTMQLY
jgi:hypothetical protein